MDKYLAIIFRIIIQPADKYLAKSDKIMIIKKMVKERKRYIIVIDRKGQKKIGKIKDNNFGN